MYRSFCGFHHHFSSLFFITIIGRRFGPAGCSPAGGRDAAPARLVGPREAQQRANVLHLIER